MSGLEIAAGIAGIVSAFVTVGRAVKSFRDNRKKKKKKLQEEAESAESRLLNTVDNGPPRINGEYSRDVARVEARGP